MNTGHTYNLLFDIFQTIQALARDTTTLINFLEVEDVATAEALLDHINKMAHEVSTALLIVTACDEK